MVSPQNSILKDFFFFFFFFISIRYLPVCLCRTAYFREETSIKTILFLRIRNGFYLTSLAWLNLAESESQKIHMFNRHICCTMQKRNLTCSSNAKNEDPDHLHRVIRIFAGRDLYIAKEQLSLQDSKYSDQTVLMRSLIWVFAGRTFSKVYFFTFRQNYL